MPAPQINDIKQIIPTADDFEKILNAKELYEAAQKTPTKDAWNKANFILTPWGIAYNSSKAKYNKSLASYNKVARKPKMPPEPKYTTTLRYFVVASLVGWDELVNQLKTTLRNWEFTTRDLQQLAKDSWQNPAYANDIIKALMDAQSKAIQNKANSNLTEAAEKHKTLNSKLFTKDGVLKDNVRDKMLEIVDEFLADLKKQNIKVKVDDILLIGSNASYNYTKNSDIDLHILTNAKAANYDSEVATALYGAYRTIFNKNLDITIYDIPLEIFVETEDSTRVSNGIYSVKKNKWVKKPVQEDIPDYDTKALDRLTAKWEIKCKDLINDIKADKLNDEKKVIKLLDDIYDKLRKKGVAKGEYAIENLAFKELRNKGYLDQLKEFKNELVSKRLSLEETLNRQTRVDIHTQLTRAAGTQPIIQDNGMFFIYNLKASDVDRAINAIRKLPFVIEASANESGKYNFADMNALLRNNMPSKYYNIRGRIEI